MTDVAYYEIYPIKRCWGCDCDVAWTNHIGLCYGCDRKVPRG